MRTRRAFRPSFGFAPTLDFLPKRIAPSDITTMMVISGGGTTSQGSSLSDPNACPQGPITTIPTPPPPSDTTGDGDFSTGPAGGGTW